jgi:hypothetical protein
MTITNSTDRLKNSARCIAGALLHCRFLKILNDSNEKVKEFFCFWYQRSLVYQFICLQSFDFTQPC